MNKENVVQQNSKNLATDVQPGPPRLRIHSDSSKCMENHKKNLKPSLTKVRPALNDIINLKRFKTVVFNPKEDDVQENKAENVENKSTSTLNKLLTVDRRTNQDKPKRSFHVDRVCDLEAGSSAERSKSVNIDSKFVTIRESISYGKLDDDLDEVFVDGADYFNREANNLKFGEISPVKPNVFTSSSTVLIPGLREKLAQKTTLVNKLNKNRKTVNELIYVNDNLYEEEYLEEYVLRALKEDKRFVLKNATCKTDIETAQDRCCVLDWLLKVEAYNLIPTSIYLKAVRLLDLVLNSTEVSVNMYQLVAMASIWIMNKYETSNIYIPIKRLISLSGNAYSGSQLTKMEHKLLKFLDFRCEIPEPTIFVEYFLFKTKIENVQIRHASYYLLECFSISPYFPMIPSALLGASVFHLSLELLEENINVWENVRESSAYFTPEAMDTTKAYVMRQLMRISEQSFIYKEYNVQRKLFVSMVLAEKFKKPKLSDTSF